MEIRIDEKQMQEVLGEQATKGIQNAFDSYSVRSIMEKVVADSVIPSIMTAAMEAAVKKIDIDDLSQKLAEQIARSTTAGAVNVIRETMVTILMDIRKVPQYDDDKRKRAREEILAAIF